MIKTARIVILIFASYITSAQTQQKYTVSGNVRHSFAYCGGAAPSEEMMAEFTKLKPYTGKTLYIRKGKANNIKAKVILSFKADSAGNFTFQLPPGVYSIIQEPQVKKLNIKFYKKKNIIVDEKCLKTWWDKPYYLLEVKDKNINELDFKFYHPCFIPDDIPCLQYDGPMPP